MPPLSRRSHNKATPRKDYRVVCMRASPACYDADAASAPVDCVGINDSLDLYDDNSVDLQSQTNEVAAATSPVLSSTPAVVSAQQQAQFHSSFEDGSDSILVGINVDMLDNAAAGVCKVNRLHEGAGRETPVLQNSSRASLASPLSPGNRSMALRARRRLRENALRSTTLSQRLAKETARRAEADRLAADRRRASELAEEVLREKLAAEAAAAAKECFYGLPSSVAQLLKQHRGIEKLYDWQDECLRLDAVQQRRNLIYALPTSGGKTLVAELLALRELLVRGKDVLFVLPFVAIVQEKVKSLSAFALDLGFLVEEYAGSKGAFPPRQRRKYRSLCVATIEKANSLVNSLHELGRLSHLGLVVVDELHMIGEGGSRGALLEMTLTKLLCCSVETQIVGMSATIANIKELQTFMDAEVYTNNFRPVALEEYVKIEDSIFRVDPKSLEIEDKLCHHRFVRFPYTKYMSGKDPDHLLGLVSEVIPEYSCLIFCPTKKNCENVAELLCSMMDGALAEVKKVQRSRLLSDLQDNCGRVCRILARTIRYGVAYHHSGLTTDERRLIEEAYTDGTLCLLACTSTLAAGVNLPAKRVIVRSPHVGMQVLSSSQYRQMIGRAGRAGIDTSGESILIVQRKDKSKLTAILCGSSESCLSSLYYDNGKGFRRFILTLIGLKICSDVRSVVEVVQRTLLSVQARHLGIDLIKATHAALQWLIEHELISQKKARLGSNNWQSDAAPTVMAADDRLLRPSSEAREADKDSAWKSEPIESVQLDVTELGRAACKGSVDIEISQQLYKDLCKAQESLCLANYLHLLYLVTPYETVEQINPVWQLYLQMFNQLTATEQRVASIVGVEEAHLVRRVAGQKARKGIDEYPVRRFYVTLMLYALWQKNSVWSVADKFQEDRGKIQNLLHSSASFAVCVHHFSQELQELWAYQELFSAFVKKLSYCTSVELLPLMEIPGIKVARARQLYNYGLRTLQHIAHCDPEMLVRNIEHMPRKLAREVVCSAMMLLREKAESLREEAEDIVCVPSDNLL